MKKAVLVLSDGTIIYGKGLGAKIQKVGELVFNTSMTGYQEALTDPSYAGQILLMTYPLIGNYGINKSYCESNKVWVEGFVVRWAEKNPFHYLSESNLDEYLKKNNVGGIYDIDTRMLTKKIRKFGVMMAAYQVYENEKEKNIDELFELIKKTDYSSINFVKKVSTNKVLSFGNGEKKVVLIDYGVKHSIINQLVSRRIKVIVVPFNFTDKQILDYNPDGIVLSNGPGDPALLKEQIEVVKKLFGQCPIMGICLGHQLIGCAAGAKTYKLKFGHRGSNHPVLDKKIQKVFITTQNHGYAVDFTNLKNNKDWELTHINLNDDTVEGIENSNLKIFSVQYHPEAHPGPHDSFYLFDKFVKLIKG
jgi:carbamoyl-phosphate synthase small subunit